MVQLKAEGIKKSFDGRTVLEGVSLELRKGELVSLLGASGGGKTTLFQILAGLSLPDEGHVYMEGQEVTGKPGKVSYMLQKDLLLPYRTVIDNVALPLLLSGVKKAEARKKAAGYFPMFGLEGTEKKYPSQLSGGMRQRAALLRTYLSSKPIALLDEPFSALDMLTKHTLHEWYLRVMEEIKLSTLFITHDIDEAILLSDRICILTGSPGKITREILIEEPKPRSKDFPVSEEFLEYKKEILKHLEQR
ncbi:ABC transporter ATP-binding protein [Lacrimispora sp. JR3]|uniref:ABC transporter ATP-binding protein n=1 Tax=Lacrimispora sinapis TaxID=3111456 RepID=UPI0037483600